MVDKLINIYAVIWAIGYLWFVVPIRRWWRRHRRDADYFAHLGWKDKEFYLGLGWLLREDKINVTEGEEENYYALK